MKTEIPPALALLKEWSIWLVSLQTGALGLISFVSGKADNLSLNAIWLKRTIYWFAASIIAATFVLAALPSIVLRMNGPDPYQVYLFEWLPIHLWWATGAQHYFFIFGLLCFVFAVTKKKNG